MSVAPTLLHATAIAIDGRAVLLRGPSGIGKSDLALRLIDRGAVLLSDDYVELSVNEAGVLVAHAPAAIAGRMEVRGIGLVPLPYVAQGPVALLVALEGAVERLPAAATQELCGIAVPAVTLRAFEASAPLKVELALKVAMKTLEIASS